MKPHIVLADDNTDMLAYVKRLLSPYYDVTAVPNGWQPSDSPRPI